MGCSASIWAQTLLTLRKSSSTWGWSLFDESCRHWLSDKRRNLGPCCHLSAKHRTGIPGETSSATFSSPGICFHWEGSASFWISPTLTGTNGLNFLASLPIHTRTILLSKNRMTFTNRKRDSCTMVLNNREPKTAPWSSKRGMVNLFQQRHCGLRCNKAYVVLSIWLLPWCICAGTECFIRGIRKN